MFLCCFWCVEFLSCFDQKQVTFSLCCVHSLPTYMLHGPDFVLAGRRRLYMWAANHWALKMHHSYVIILQSFYSIPLLEPYPGPFLNLWNCPPLKYSILFSVSENIFLIILIPLFPLCSFSFLLRFSIFWLFPDHLGSSCKPWNLSFSCCPFSSFPP